MTPEMVSLCSMLSCVTARCDQYSHIQIKETDPSARLKTVTLFAAPGDWFSFSPDKGRGKAGQMSPLLSSGKEYDHHRACDAVVIARKGNELLVVYIDLKSGNPTGYAGQFKSTRRFVRYALGLLDEFKGFSFGEPNERYIILYGGRKPLLNKKPSVPRRSAVGASKPDQAYKREVPDGARLYLNEFLV